MKTIKNVSLIIAVGMLLGVSSIAYASDFHFENVHIEDIKINNNANVQNTVQTTANTGGNTTTATGGNATNTVNTGNAGSQTTVTNCVNTTGINGNANCGNSPTNVPSATPIPTATPTPGNVSGCTSNCGGGNPGPGSSSLSSSDGSNSNTAVLGTATFAGTGTFTENMMNTLLLAGIVILSLGGYSYAKEKRK